MFAQKPEPYLFAGGDASEYEVFIGEAGTWCTKHLKSGKTIQSVSPANNMLSIANLGLNILNLGIGVYNAFQLKKIKKQLNSNHKETQVAIDSLNTNVKTGFQNLENQINQNQQEIKAYFQSIEYALTLQHRTLQLLVANQNNLQDSMRILRQEMHSGFQNVIKEIKNTEALRQREEFETRTFKLLKVYERFTQLLPSESEVEPLIERAEDLEAWLRSQLNRIEVGKVERLPLFVGLTFSIRAKADAFAIKGEEYTNFAKKEITLLINEICSEVNQLCEGSNLYYLGVQIPEIIYQYMLLNRSLRQGLNLQSREYNQEEIANIFSPDTITWDDGMEELRKIFSTKVESEEAIHGKTAINLRTLADYEWYIDFAGCDRSTFSVHTCARLELWQILKKIGYYSSNSPDGVRLPKSSLNTVMNFALPKASQKVACLIQQEFELETAPKLLIETGVADYGDDYA